MVSYYNTPNMYRHHQQAPNTSMHAWYPTYHHAQAAAEPQLWEQQMWHHHTHVSPHAVFNNPEYGEYVHSSPTPGMGATPHAESQLMSPTVTVASGSELSSPGGGMSPLQPQTVARPPPARSPFEWIKKTSYQTQQNPGKTRTKDKYRVVYTDHQRVELEKEFYYSRYITIRRKAELANNLGLSERQVKIWFQNRRAKERKQVKKREETTQKDPSSVVNVHHQQLLQTEPEIPPVLM